jgi:hypothetical protein
VEIKFGIRVGCDFIKKLATCNFLRQHSSDLGQHSIRVFLPLLDNTVIIKMFFIHCVTEFITHSRLIIFSNSLQIVYEVQSQILIQRYQVYKVIHNFKTSVSVCLIMKLIYQFLFIVVEKVYYTFYSRIMAITRSGELRYSPAARGTK